MAPSPAWASNAVKAKHDKAASVDGKPVLIDITNNDDFFGVVQATVTKQPKHGQVVVYDAWKAHDFPVHNHKATMATDSNTGGLVYPHPLDNPAGFFTPSDYLPASETSSFVIDGASIYDRYLVLGNVLENNPGGAGDIGEGAAYIYERRVDADGRIFWQFLQKLTGSEVRVGADGFADPAAPQELPEDDDSMGWTAQFSDGQLFVGAFRRKVLDTQGNQINRGVVYVYELSTKDLEGNDLPDHDGDGKPDSLWIFKQRLLSTVPQPPELGPGDFGEFFALEGEWAFISSNNQDVEVNGENVNVAGIVEVFRRHESGSWQHHQTFLDPDGDGSLFEPLELGFFGTRMDIQGERALISRMSLLPPDYVACDADTNTIFLYELDKEDQWRFTQKIQPRDNPEIPDGPVYCSGYVADFGDDGWLMVSTFNFYIAPENDFMSLYKENDNGMYELRQSIEQPSLVDAPFTIQASYFGAVVHEDLLVAGVENANPLLGLDPGPDKIEIFQRDEMDEWILIDEVIEPEESLTSFGFGQPGFAADELFMYVPAGDPLLTGSRGRGYMFSTHPMVVYVPDESGDAASDNFEYELTDPFGETDAAKVTIRLKIDDDGDDDEDED